MRWMYALSLLALTEPATAQTQLPEVPIAGNPGPVIDEVLFQGNRKIPTERLRQIAALPVGTPLSAEVVKPALERVQAAYAALGDNYVYPKLDEIRINHARVTFAVREGLKAWPETDEPGPPPKWLDAYFGNTMVCAAAKTGNDLCHMWLEKDGSFIIFDPNGVHHGHYKIGKVRPDGRVPICRYWDSAGYVTPSGFATPAAPPFPAPTPNAAAPEPGMVCTTKSFRTVCTRHADIRGLSAEEQRKARRTMVQRNSEEGICYAHGPHKVGDVWYEWDDPLPGQIGLDRQILMAGHQ